MDTYERLLARARAEWRAKLAGKTSLWGFHNWATDRFEHHHIAREKFGPIIIPVPISMHQELTRRMMEEHPPEGADPTNPLEIRGRLDLGMCDLLECLADGYRKYGENRLALAKKGVRKLNSTVVFPPQFCMLLLRVSKFLAEDAKNCRNMEY